MTTRRRIERIDPAAGIPGGEIIVECSGSDRADGALSVMFQTQPAHVVAAKPDRALILIPNLEIGARVDVSLEHESEVGTVPFQLAEKIADGVHAVTSPAFDPSDGALFVTRSGSRGEHVPVSIFRIDSQGKVEEFSGDITNPTSIAFDRTGRMFVTSRLDGTVYRVTALKEVVAFASDLGIATGLAFNRHGEMFVGDRSGTIHRVDEIGEATPWVEMEPSVSAYHMAFGPDHALYVTGPTVSSFDSIMRFDQEGEASTFFRGLGRPQGLAFDVNGNLYVAASLRGRRGIVRISPDGVQAEIIVAGMNLVGLAFGPAGEMVVATNEAVYRLPIGIFGTLLD
jgi:sugar lactone lactonase YvrE